MPNESREARADAVQVLLPWGIPSTDVRDDGAGSATLWVTGSVFLAIWTAVALVLTSA